jgi:lipopolysaccharide transport system permease protein
VRPIIYSDAAQLAQPASFVRGAVRDLRTAPRIGARLFTAQLRGKVRRSLLGYLWLILPAAAVTILCVYLQSLGVLRSGATELPYALHVLTGVLLWQVFVEALNAPLQHLTAARQLISRSPVAHEAIFFGALCDVLLTAAIRLLLLLAAFALYEGGTVPGLGLPLGMLALVLLGFAIGLLVAPWGLLYDDARHGLTMATTFWFFLTPVAYQAAPGGIAALNPVTPLLGTARASFASGAWSGGFLLVAAVSAVMLAAGWTLYRLARPYVVERLG